MNRFTAITRLRLVMEDPQQLRANSVASYMIDQLSEHGNRPAEVFIPGFTQCDLSGAAADMSETSSPGAVARMNGPFCEGGTGLRRALRHRSKTASVPLNMASVAKYARGPNAVIRPAREQGVRWPRRPHSTAAAYCSTPPSAPARAYR